jgi:GNAT superfamily N-acetyltransferase
VPEPLEVRRVAFTDPDVVRLVVEVQQEYVLRYGSPDETPLDPAMFDPPGGVFFLAYAGGLPVAMGGWRLRPDVRALGRTTAAEVKRMYVAAAARRRGLARLVLARLEGTARAAGADLMVLETGLAQPEAIALYESAGYVPVEGFGHYRQSEVSRCFGKPL